MAEDDQGVVYDVYYLNAPVGGPPGVHSYINEFGRAVNVELWNPEDKKPCQLPLKYARTFIEADPAFLVRSPDGRIMQPKSRPIEGRDGMLMLQDDQCIAVYDELTREALLVRANDIAEERGRGKFKQGAKKEDLIRYLTGTGSLPLDGLQSVHEQPTRALDVDESDYEAEFEELPPASKSGMSTADLIAKVTSQQPSRPGPKEQKQEDLIKKARGA